MPVTNTPRVPDRATVVRTALAGVGWLVVAALGVIAFGRLVHLDDAVAWPYTGINALTPVIYLPAYAVVAVAFALRRNFLLVAAVALVVVHLVWTVPEVIPGGAELAPADSAPVRLLTANLNYGNDQADRLDGLVRAEQPDVVVLQEVSALNVVDLDASAALVEFPHREVHPAAGAFGWAVYSTFPLSDVDVPVVGGEFPMPRMTVTVDEQRSFVLFAVHTISPTNSAYTKLWRSHFDLLSDEADRADLPVVMAGDFNATRDHRPFRELRDVGLRDAHDAAHAGWSPTWQVDGLLPPLLRLDHVLASRAFEVTGYRVGDEIGSDHLPVVVDLALM